MGCAASQDETFSLEDLGVYREKSAPDYHVAMRACVGAWKKNVGVEKVKILTKNNIAQRLKHIRMGDAVNTWRRKMENRAATNARLYQEQVAFIESKSSASRRRATHIERLQKRLTPK